MPPKKKAAATTAPTTPPLQGCEISTCGRMSITQKGVEELVAELGGKSVKTVTKNCTHLITLRDEAESYKANSLYGGKVGRAHDQNCHVISEDWLLEVKKQQTHVAEDEYLWSYIFDQEKKNPPAANGAPNGTSGTKRAANGSVANGVADKKTKVKKTKAENGVKEEKETVAEGQFVKKKDAVIPLDSFCDQVDHLVYIDPDSGMIYDASLNQANASNNNNKFYIIQLLHHPKNKTFKTWTRWGRVGESGQKALLGDGSFADAVKQFEKKFKDKSGLRWDDRTENPKPGKYAFIERSYESDSEDESDDEDAPVKDENGDVKMKEEEEETKIPECTLAKPVENLMDMIFNDSFFQATMTSLNYDANKLPLGKLSKATILRGFAQLKDLAAIINDPDTAATQYGPNLATTMEQLSNTYYSLIPHDFGRNRPPIIRDQTSLKKEVELLESLSDMKVAADLMKVDRKAPADLHPADRRFKGLNLDEMTPLKPTSKEYKLLSNYLTGTVGSTHNYNYQVVDIFRVQRQGEAMRFKASKFSDIPSDRRLLWHGSRCTNFGGILSQGLRIAPPEAPVSGYMFGKGIYLADISSKSAGYCASYCSNGEGLLLLCEAELGNPMQELRNGSYTAGESAKEGGMYSTKGMGSMAPKKWIDAGAVNKDLKGVQMPDASSAPETVTDYNSLYYNEYICYDVDQVQLRYLFRVKMN